MVADAGVGTNATTHIFYIGPQTLRQVGYFIHETDLGGQHGVGCVLGQFRRPDVHENHAVVATIERVVDLMQQLFGPLTVGANDNAVGLHEIGNGRAFLKKLRVGHDIEVQLQPALVQLGTHRSLDPVASTNRHGGLVHHHLVVIHILANGARHGGHILQVGGTVFIRRCTHCNELQRPMGHGFLGIGGERQAACLDRMLYDGLEARLINRYMAVPKLINLALIHIHTQNVMTHIGQTGTRDKTNVTCAKNSNFHPLKP